MKTIKSAVILVGLVLASLGQCLGQTNLQFTGISVTGEGAMHLAWSSVSNELYEVDEADALIDTNTGSITWNKIYDNYPSQGTNTFWLDTGNYNFSPQIVHPKDMPMRFYRIVDLGPDSTSDEPTVVINTPTNSTIASSEITITVTAFTDQPVLSGTKLYVDGQEMLMADTTTNYTDSTGVTNYEVDTYSINTCEWLNGTHILFATTECQSGRGDLVDSGTVATGHGVSPFVSVLFNNLVEGISFSQPLFDPSSGQTQQVTAIFPLNSDWTLHIVDAYSNVVQTATGSGNSMLYNWDGTANGTNLANGIYYYYITAATNGLANELVSGGSSGGSGGGVPSPSFARASAVSSESSEQLWAVATDSENVLPLAIYPPGFDTNGLTIFSATPAEIQSLRTPVSRVASSRTASFSTLDSGGGTASPSGIGDPGYVTPLPDPQPAPPSPQRPPNNPVKGLAGTFGVAYDTYTANGGTNPVNCAILGNGLPGNTGHISMQNNSATRALPFSPLPQYKTEVNNFVSQMQHWGWKNSFLKVDDQLNINDLRGSGTPFNNVNIGVLFTHGVYGTSVDFAANQCKQNYFPITSGGSAQYLRLSEMNLGGSGTNGLKWMALNSCRSLYQANWNSMKNAGIKPYNGNLHLLMGENTDGFTSSSFGWYWAKYINFGTGTNAASFSPLTVRAAWYQAAKDAYHNVAFPAGTPAISYAVAGDSACHDDTLQTNSTPGGSWFYDSTQVWP
jgi:hypothetical protein